MAERKPTDVPDSILYNETAIRNNFQVLEYSRTCHAALAGIAAGILGLTSLWGFGFYFLMVLLQAGIWEMKSNFEWNKYFFSRSLIVNYSFVGGLFTYVLLWVFIYGIVHVY
ncbi:unnamed protein product [Bursaphelenchus okinawaensis]|uniref:ER membrane protein complex subunit 6 n=1 Tax=Bursaphelenchus okinawaensis TaxID=465554 RepID=A0A811LLS6_9BILA|nr:unnamed protein product [Bursaphelenchus okinawaensis]CAG9125647.1 unnamed protein product [Bursaphelenchus okinawaensis]